MGRDRRELCVDPLVELLDAAHDVGELSAQFGGFLVAEDGVLSQVGVLAPSLASHVSPGR